MWEAWEVQGMLLNGVQLSILVGRVVPLPASHELLDALQSVNITVKDTGTSGFELVFSIGKRSPLQVLFLLTSGQPVLFTRVVLLASLGGRLEVLMDGLITHHTVTPGKDGASGTLSIKGEDLSAAMNLLDLSGLPYPACPAEARVLLMLAKYLVLGIVPVVVPSVLIDVPIPTGRIPGQQGTDLEYIRGLAEDVGYVFYVEPGPIPGQSVAYWGPQIKVGIPQPALNVDMDAHTNVESLSFQFDSQQNEIPVVYHYEEISKVPIPIPIPPITPLSPPLGLLPPIPARLSQVPLSDDLAKRSLPQAVMIGLARAAQAAEAVTGTGSLDVLRYGRVLRARQLVGVRGAGLAFDGLHYVKSVTHSIKRGEYKQQFELSRNGLLSIVPRVFS
jgi:hypothetical protein